MGIAELEAAWRERPTEWDEEWRAFDVGRENAIPRYKEPVKQLLGGEIDPQAFRTQMDSLSKKENWWGFRGNSQMFLNQLVKAADETELAEALKAGLPPPPDANEARAKITAFLTFVEGVRTRAEAMGRTKPHLGRVPAFLSFFWELEERDNWPLFYPSSRNVLEEFGVLDVSGGFEDIYERYRTVIFELRERLTTNTWGVEHFLWTLSPQGKDEPEKPKSEEGGQPPDGGKKPAGDVYASYRADKLIFPDDVVTSFILSLATKRFVILSGISGTGKTQIALGLARHLESAAGGELVEVAEPVDDAENAYIKLTPGRFQRMRSTLRQSARQVLGVPPRGTSASLEVALEDGGAGSLRINNIGFSDESKEAVIMFFRKDMADWVRERARTGDYVHFHVPKNGDDPSVRIVKQKVEESGERVERHSLIPVRSDWTDPRGLLGYWNPITEHYVRTELLDLILRAAADPDHPYIAILDEMNLARVEYYFSDFLSAIESGKAIPLLPSSVSEDTVDEDIPTKLELPPNLSFVGTVNVDETTHAFSPKVLDRANVIEFNEVALDQALAQGAPPAASEFRLGGGVVDPGWFIGDSDTGAQIKAAQEQAEFTEPLADVHGILERFNRPFGYRVINEVSAFVGHATDKIDHDAEATVGTAFDFQLCQKILPKLTGGRELEEPLAHLLRYCLNRTSAASIDVDKVTNGARKVLYPVSAAASAPPQDATAQEAGETATASVADDAADDTTAQAPVEAAYPRAAKKLLRMLDRLRNTGFVSAIE